MPHRRLSRRGEIRFAITAIFVSLLSSGLWINERFFEPKRYYADQGMDGPFTAIPDGTGSNSGVPRYTTGYKLASVAPGQTFTWRSSICLEADAFMLAHAEMTRLRDGAVLVSSRHALWTPEDRRCGVAIGSATMPLDAEDGLYEERRIAVVRPNSWWPLQAPLSSLRFTVARATKPDR
jgi:hypothetical protein